MIGRVALVTGAGRGIGRATALALAARGARVMAVSRSADTLVALAAEAELEWLAADLATREACEQVVEATRRRLGPVEILVNNAGIGSTASGAIWDQDGDDWRATMAVNLDAPFHLTQLASRDMRALGRGRIVMVASTAGLAGSPREIAYTTAKHGLIGLMRATAQDIGVFGATCNAVCPGWVRTPMSDRSAALHAERDGTSVEEIWRARDAGYRRGRVPTAEEVAATIVFLCSEAASGVSGEAIRVAAADNW